MKTRAVLLAIVLTLTTALPALAATQESGSLKIKKVDKSRYPELKFHLGLTTTEKNVTFKVREDGKEIKNIEVTSKVYKQPVDVTLIIDVSGSMIGKPLDDAKSAAKLFVERAQPGDQIAIVAFSSTVNRILDFTDDKQKLSKAIDGLAAEGETAVFDALIDSLKATKDRQLENQSLILLSDGGDTASRQSGEEAAELAGSLRIPVSVVTLQSAEFNPDPITNIARRSTGHALTALSSSALEGLYDGLAAELHHGYQLTFKSRTTKTKAKVDVEAFIQGQRLRASTLVVTLAHADKPTKAPVQTRPAGKLTRVTSLPLAVSFAFLAAFLLVVGIGGYLTSGTNTLSEQLKYYDQLRGRYKKSDDTMPALKRLHESLVNLVQSTSARYDFTAYAQGKLEQAGLPVKPHEYITLHLLGVAAVSLTTVLLFGGGLFSFSLMVLAAFGPLAAVQVLIDRRKTAFNEQLPDTLDLIASSLRAGYGLQQAVVAAARDAREPTAGELTRVSSQVQMGMTLEAALDKLAERIGDTSFRWVVLAITIHRETGGNLAELLDNLSASLRQREVMRRQIKALTAEGRLSAAILIVLPFAETALMFALNPTYMNLLFTSLPGVAMLAGALTLMAIGGLWLKSMTNIEY